MSRGLHRILIVDDHRGWRDAIRSIVEQEPELQVVGEESDGVKAFESAVALQPDLVLLDINIPSLSGIEVARRIRTQLPRTKILFVTTYVTHTMAEACLGEGASGFVAKADAYGQLLQAIHVICDGRRFISESVGCQTLRLDCVAQEGAPGTALFSVASDILHATRYHELEVYADDNSLARGFAGFIKSALDLRKAVIVIATEPRLAAVHRSLASIGTDVVAAIKQGRYITQDPTAVLSSFMKNGKPDSGRFEQVAGELVLQAKQAARGEIPKVAACGECAPMLLAHGNVTAAIELEHFWDGLARDHGVDILCGYPSDSYKHLQNTPAFSSIKSLHSAIHGC